MTHGRKGDLLGREYEDDSSAGERESGERFGRRTRGKDARRRAEVEEEVGEETEGGEESQEETPEGVDVD